MGRPPKYEWDDKKDICHRLFVQEKRSIPDIIAYFAQHFGVDESELPNARLFRRQFTEKWKFPSRKDRLGGELEATIAERAKQLWSQNLELKDIHQTLTNEGHNINTYDLRKITTKHGLVRRQASGYRPLPQKPQRKRKRVEDVAEEEHVEGGAFEDALPQDVVVDDSFEPLSGLQQAALAAIPADVAASRAEYLQQLQVQSDVAMSNRKRRRRIRGYGHLPPDAPGLPPRYASETSLDECKAYLHVGNDMYQAIRRDYEEICGDMEIERKKTCIEDGRWQASKDRLVRENLHLSAMLHPLQGDLDKKAMALDVICMDVTKRMRSTARNFSLAQANNELGLSPTESKEVRRKFYAILEADHYTTRLACGDDHWAELRQRWFDSSPVLQQVMRGTDQHKIKCVDKLCRDAMKRYNDDRIRQDPSKLQYQQSHYGPGPGAVTHGRKGSRRTKEREEAIQKLRQAMGLPAWPRPVETSNSFAQPQDPGVDFELDPALSNPYANMPQHQANQSIPAYFRLSTASTLIGNHPRMWLGKLARPNMAELRKAATSKTGAATVAKVQGIVKGLDGSEDSYQIDGDDELGVYLEAAGEKSTFVVVLEGGYA